MTYVWLMGPNDVAHAVDEDVELRQGWAVAKCARPVHFNVSSDVEDPKCEVCEAAVLNRCGTYGGYQKHRKYKTPICDACRRANTRYQKARRKSRPEIRDADRAGEAARWRARLRLCTEYPDRYLELLAEERGRTS